MRENSMRFFSFLSLSLSLSLFFHHVPLHVSLARTSLRGTREKKSSAGKDQGIAEYTISASLAIIDIYSCAQNDSL